MKVVSWKVPTEQGRDSHRTHQQHNERGITLVTGPARRRTFGVPYTQPYYGWKTPSAIGRSKARRRPHAEAGGNCLAGEAVDSESFLCIKTIHQRPPPATTSSSSTTTTLPGLGSGFGGWSRRSCESRRMSRAGTVFLAAYDVAESRKVTGQIRIPASQCCCPKRPDSARVSARRCSGARTTLEPTDAEGKRWDARHVPVPTGGKSGAWKVGIGGLA